MKTVAEIQKFYDNIRLVTSPALKVQVIVEIKENLTWDEYRLMLYADPKHGHTPEQIEARRTALTSEEKP